MTKYVLLMRHGKHELAIPCASVQRKLTTEGRRDTSSVAETLASVLMDLRSDADLSITIGPIWRASSDEVIETTELVTSTLRDLLVQTPEHIKELDPKNFKPYRNIGVQAGLLEKLREMFSQESDHNAALVIGHQPLLGWLANELTGSPLPITNSELLCIAIDEGNLTKPCPGYLRWAISPFDDQAIADLKEKIKSKMDTAKLLGGLITAVLGFLLASLIDSNKMAFLGDYKERNGSGLVPCNDYRRLTPWLDHCASNLPGLSTTSRHAVTGGRTPT